jgi:hypothetical protein
LIFYFTNKSLSNEIMEISKISFYTPLQKLF